MDDSLTFRNIRNSDFQEVTLEASYSEVYNIIFMLVRNIIIIYFMRISSYKMLNIYAL